MNQEIQRIININENMLRYAEIEMKKQAYLDAMFALDKINKDLSGLSAEDKKNERVILLWSNVKRKKEQVLKKAISATPKQINYGDHPIEVEADD